MKWTKPQAMVQTFTANEYVAACYGFTDTKIVVTELPTDGKLTTPGVPSTWNKTGFNDDGFDFLSGGDDHVPSGGKAWYGTKDALATLHENSPKPVMYRGDSFGNVKCGKSNALSNVVYYFGKNASDPVLLNASNCGDYGVGPNAS